MEHFSNEMYGIVPGNSLSPEVRIIEEATIALNSKGIRKQIQLIFPMLPLIVTPQAITIFMSSGQVSRIQKRTQKTL